VLAPYLIFHTPINGVLMLSQKVRGGMLGKKKSR
jgi:hypothetical protein